MQFDVVVAGLGVIGSAAVYHTARRGRRVLGLERFEPNHDRGSSHGSTRIIRLGYFEHPSYVPLLRSAYRLWRETETAVGQRLLNITGIAEIGPPDGVLVDGTLAAARLHQLSHRVLDAPELMRRFPAFRLPRHYVGVLQPDGGVIAVEPAIRAHLGLAQAAGAELRFHEPVLAIEPAADVVRIVTDHGIVEAGAVVIAAGSWVKKLLPDLPAPLKVTRQVIAWFQPEDAASFLTDRFPVFILESHHGIHYGFPHDGIGVKVGKHYLDPDPVDPDTCPRTVSGHDEAAIRNALADHVPGANGPLRAATTCLYTETPDRDFVIDCWGSSRLIVASPCSGHGFKFAPVIGEILADLACTGTTAHDISRFRLDRFGAGVGTDDTV